MAGLMDIAGHYKYVEEKKQTSDLSPLFKEKLYKKSLGDDIPCLVDRAVDGFEFLVTVTCKNMIKLSSSVDGLDNGMIGLEQVACMCLRKILISFDLKDYVTAIQLSKILLLFAKEHTSTIRLIDLAVRPFTHPSNRIEPELFIGIASHVKDLVPIYKFANNILDWNRVAGVIATDGDLRNAKSKLPFKEAMSFLDSLLDSLERLDKHQHMQYLVKSVHTRTFVFDSFSDIIMMATTMLNGETFGEKKEVSRRVSCIMKKYAKSHLEGDRKGLDEVIFKSSAISEFCRDRYDSLRVKLIRLYISLLKVIQMYNKMIDFDSFLKDNHYENKCFVTIRFEAFPKCFAHLNILMKIMFGPDNIIISLLLQGSILQNDIDLAEHSSLQSLNDKTVGESSVAGGLKCPKLIKSYGIWPFTLVYNVNMVTLLRRFVLGKEVQKLKVIDALGKSVLGRQNISTIENLSFHTASALEATIGCTISESEIEDLLLETIKCGNKDGKVIASKDKNWAKSKSRKYSKMILRLLKGFVEFNLHSQLRIRQESVQYLLEKLKVSTLSFCKIPSGLEDDIASSQDPKLVKKACDTIYNWNKIDVDKISFHILQLLNASEKVTMFFQNMTGGAIPHVKSITNPNWTMREDNANINCIYSDETLTSLKDMTYIHKVLLELIEAKKK